SIVTPWLDGGDVTTYLSRNDALPNVQKSVGLAAGVRYMHAENVCHGDLSGRNVLLDDEHNIKICDLGLGTWIKTTVAPLSQTEGGGTSYYMAPEIWALNYRTSTATVLDRAASDVYAFACLAFEMIFGKPPFRFDNPVQVSLKVTRGQRPSRPTAPVIEDQLWAVIEQCWAHDPNERPSMGNIVTRMEGWGWDAL
ncbi:kinase-like domain-containing protein, partial [Mycena filopes]